MDSVGDFRRSSVHLDIVLGDEDGSEVGTAGEFATGQAVADGLLEVSLRESHTYMKQW